MIFDTENKINQPKNDISQSSPDKVDVSVKIALLNINNKTFST